MKLPKKDMTFYGLCPVRDEFYLVTCNYCQIVCTPQGLKNHIELKHAHQWTSHPQDSENCVHPTAAAPISSSAKLKVAKKAASGQAAVPNALAYLLSTPSRPRSSKRGASGNEKMPSPQQPPPAVPFSPLQPSLAAPSPVSPLTTGGSSTIPSSPAITMTVAVDSSGVQTVQIHLPEIANGIAMPNSPTEVEVALRPPGSTSRSNKKRRSSKSERRLLPLKEREFDPEKHCGVWISDIYKACTRSLTCKAHSLTLRRAVQGRSRSFDDLLVEHRAAKESMLKQLKEGSSPVQPAKAAPPPPPALSPLTVTKPVQSKHRSPTIRPPPAKKALLSSLLQTATELTVDVPSTETDTQLPASGLLQRVFPSPVSLSFTAHHPKPLAVCSFGMRRTSRTVTSDRKWDFLRSTLRSTLQHPKNSGAMQSLLRPPSVHVQPHETNIELPNGLQLSIGVQPDGHKYEIDCLNGRTFENGATVEWDPV